MKADHLTEPDPVLEQQRLLTPHGMAHWAGTGPAGKCCKSCVHWGYWYTGWSRKRNDEVSRRKSSCCEIFYRRTGVHGGTLPAGTPACKYFE